MKVLVVGAKWHDDSPAIVAEGFKACGHDTRIFYDNQAHWSQKAARFLSRTPFRGGVTKAEERYRQHVTAGFFASIAAYRPDFVFVIAGFRLPHAAISEARRKYGMPIANFVVDDPAFAGRTLMRDLAAYSAVFVIDRSWMPVVEYFNPGNVHYLPHAGDSRHFKPLNDMPKDLDIAFGGTMSLRMPNGPAGYLRATILNALAEAGLKIAAFSGGITEAFAEFPALRRVEYFDGYKSHDDLNALYNRAKLVLSVHSPQLKSGVSPRVFDAALAGTCQLVERKPEMPELFPDGVACFRNLAEAVSLSRELLSDDAKRERMAGVARGIALEKHLFRHRAAEVLRKTPGVILA